MSLKKVYELKKDKGFKLFDLIIYGGVVVLAAALLLSVFLTRNDDPLTGVRVYVAGTVVFTYEFDGELTGRSESVEVAEDGRGITLTVHTDGGYNVIYIDKTARTVKVTDADCRGKQCMYFAAIDDNNGLIYCNPHSLRIEPFYRNLDTPDIIM